MAYAGIAIPNLEHIRTMAAAEPLLRDAMRNLFEDIGQNTETRAKDRAPVGVGPGSHGSIRAAITHLMDPQPLPLQVTVNVAPLSNDGFRYAWALETAKSWVHRSRTGARAKARGRFLGRSISVSQQGGYHYQAAGRKGRATRRWFTGALDYRRVQSALQKACQTAEAKWAS